MLSTSVANVNSYLLFERIIYNIDAVGLLQSVDLAVEVVKNGDWGIPVPDYVL